MNASAQKALFDFPLPPARAALHDHLSALATARTAADLADAPAVRLRDRLEVARGQLATAESELASLDAEISGALRAAAQTDAEIVPPNRSVAHRKAASAVDDARRLVADLQKALDGCDVGRARKALRDLMATTDFFIREVIAEEFSDALEDRAAAVDEFIEADTKVSALMQLMGECSRGFLNGSNPDRRTAWLSALEKAAVAWRKTALPETTPAGVMAALARWRVTLAQLSSDAAAGA